MSQNDAAEFIRKLDTDPAIRSKVAEGYRKLLIGTGKESGLEFTSEDLRNAALAFSQGSYREISDTDLVMIAGGQMNYSDGGGPSHNVNYSYV